MWAGWGDEQFYRDAVDGRVKFVLCGSKLMDDDLRDLQNFEDFSFINQEILKQIWIINNRKWKY